MKAKLRVVEPPQKLSNKAYEKQLLKLQVELCHLQEWVKAQKLKVIIIFEGRDAAGKGGTIKSIMERVSPRVFRLVALPARLTGKRHSSMRNATFKTSRQLARSLSSTAAGTTVPAWSM